MVATTRNIPRNLSNYKPMDRLTLCEVEQWGAISQKLPSNYIPVP